MDPTNLFSGSDNFFKYLSLGGFLLVIISIVFPMQKNQEISLEIITWEKEVKMLNLEILQLSQKTNELTTDSKQYAIELDSLQIIRNAKGPKSSTAFKQISEIVNKYNLQFKELNKIKNQVEIKNIVVEFNGNRITALKEQAKTYRLLAFILAIAGIIFMVYGSIRWHISTSVSDKIKTIERSIKLKELARP